MQNMELMCVEDKVQIQGSLDTFNREYQQDRPLACYLLRHTTLWVYSPDSKTFGPSKFVGFQSMNFRNYAAAKRVGGKQFDGGRTHKAIEKALGTQYVANPKLSLELKRWGESLFGPDVFDRGNDTKWETKWKFISL